CHEKGSEPGTPCTGRESGQSNRRVYRNIGHYKNHVTIADPTSIKGRIKVHNTSVASNTSTIIRPYGSIREYCHASRLGNRLKTTRPPSSGKIGSRLSAINTRL